MAGILEKNGVSEERKKRIISWLYKIKYFYLQQLSEAVLFECFYIPTVLTDNKQNLDLSAFADEDTLFYDSEDFLSHLKSITRLSEKYANYHVAVMDSPKFPNIKLIRNSADNVFATRFHPPVMISYTHERINQLLKSYISENVSKRLKTDEQLKEVLAKIKTAE